MASGQPGKGENSGGSSGGGAGQGSGGTGGGAVGGIGEEATTKGPHPTDRRPELKVDPDQLAPGGDASSLSPVGRYNEELLDDMEHRDVKEEELISLGLSPAAAQTFVEKFKKFQVKTNRGERDPELEKELLELAGQVVKLKQAALRGTGLNSSLGTETGGRSEIKKDKVEELVEAQLRNLPPEYREMVEEYFKALSAQPPPPKR